MAASGVSILGGGRLYTGGSSPELLEDGAVAFNEEGIVVAVGPTAEVKAAHPQAAFKNVGGRLILPGFVCTHAHFYGMFARGMALKDEAPTNFKEILERLWWRLDKALGIQDAQVSAEVCLLQAIRCGTTTIIDHHASPNAIEGSLDAIADATLRAGVRASLCYEVTDRNGVEGAEAGIRENVRFIKRVYGKDAKEPLLGAAFGIHAPFTASDETLKKCVAALEGAIAEAPDAAGKAGFHLHVAEDGTDPADSLKRCGTRTVQRLEKAGVLGPTTLAAHCVKCDAEEIAVLARTGTQVVHNPESNMNNAVGVSDVRAMMSGGVCVGLGTDGMTLDMVQESKVNYLLHKLNAGDPRVMGGETLEMLIANNGTIASRFFGHKVGVLEKGAFADIAILSYDPPTPLSAGNMPWHMQFGIGSYMVDTTIVGGRVLMEGGKIVSLDEAAIMKRARDLCPGVWDRF